jgi:phage-related protein/predicted XRE-type DNA-binding protein
MIALMPVDFQVYHFMNAIKPLLWMGSSKRDLSAMPSDVQDIFGYALHLAQVGSKHNHAKAISGFGDAGILEVVDDYKGDTYRAVYTVRYAAAVYVLHCFQKKIKAWHRNAQKRHGFDRCPFKGLGGTRKGQWDMNTIRQAGNIAFEVGSDNPYADLGLPDSDEMLMKAGIVHEIEQIIQCKELSPQRASDLLGMPQSKLSELLRGNFRTIPKDQIAEYLKLLTAM